MTKMIGNLAVADGAGAEPHASGSQLVLIQRAHAAPAAALVALDQLWFQVSGTVCNLRCRHCFISCSPENHSFWFMTRHQVHDALAESAALGVKEYYFTGGEPFMHREILPILGDALDYGPATLLTNATLVRESTARELAHVSSASLYTLEIRVSIDGVSAEANDAIRGAGSFARALNGIRHLVAAGFLPIITSMQTWEDEQALSILRAFRQLLSGVGYHRPRLKILPPLRIGAEAERTHGYSPDERVTHEMLHGFDMSQLLCTRARLVTARGVYACPILLDRPTARLGMTLGDAVRRPALLSDAACYTCYMSGAICANAPSSLEGLG